MKVSYNYKVKTKAFQIYSNSLNNEKHCSGRAGEGRAKIIDGITFGNTAIIWDAQLTERERE